MATTAQPAHSLVAAAPYDADYPAHPAPDAPMRALLASTWQVMDQVQVRTPRSAPAPAHANKRHSAPRPP